MRKFPLILAALNFVLTTAIFGAAVSAPTQRGLLPIIVYFADYPVSRLLESLLGRLRGGLENNYLVDYCSYAIVGALWYWIIGIIICRAARRYR